MGLFKQGQAESTPVDDVESGADSVGNEANVAEVRQETTAQDYSLLLRERDQLVVERDHLRGELNALLDERDRMDAELARYRAHAERTSKLFLHASDYAAWVRQNARRDAELALRKARARADEIAGDVVREREEAQAEVERLQALASEMRARLKGFTMDALRLLETPRAAETPQPEDLEAALQSSLPERAEPRGDQPW